MLLRRNILILLILVSSSFHTIALNTGSIAGIILDENDKPAAYVSVALVGTDLGTFTNHKGYFEFSKVVLGSYELLIQSIGYKTSRHNIILNDSISKLELKLEADSRLLPQLSIIGKKDRIFSGIPGSASYVDKKEMERLQPLSGNEVFRRVPGIHVVEEEGMGLRTNIGIRGLDPDKSRNVLILEDGIPVALNPYGEPEMYYTPAIDRMSGVEILKGSGQILYGPQTIGGVINYITNDPPQEQEISAKLRGGQGQMFTGMLFYGNTFENAGVSVNYLRKQAKQVANVSYNIDDINAKLKFNTGKNGVLGIKLGLYRENSNATYIGLTQPMFDAGNNDFDFLAPFDNLSVNRQSISVNHLQKFSDRLNLQSTLFSYATSRNWRRQDYQYSNNARTTPADWSGEYWGDTSIAGGGIFMRNRTGNRERTFVVSGLEQKLTYKYKAVGLNHEMIGGYRLMNEKAYEQRINGSKPDAISGQLVDNEIRTGNAAAAYIQNKSTVNQNFEISYGVRTEFYQYEREILRTSNRDTFQTAINSIATIIPGLGFTYKFNNSHNVFGGMHRGYAPPRVKDALDFTFDNPVLQLDAEKSWNYELGLRTSPAKGVFLEFTGFYMDFENQIIPSSESSGGMGFGFTNAGRTVHSGAEISFVANSKEALKTKWIVELSGNASIINAVFAADRFKEVSGEQFNIKGNRTPYAPNSLASVGLSVEAPFGTSIRGTYTHVGNQFTDELNNIAPSANGRTGQMEAYNLIDLGIFHAIPKKGLLFNLSVKNLTNERYISTLRPQGIRVGLPRFISFGIDVKI